MDELVDIVRRYYDGTVEKEYARIDGRPEFLLTCRFMERHIQPGARVLDVGGGPGRYAHHLAARGCAVTLLDLSQENVRFAARRAKEQGLALDARAGDAREADQLVDGLFDHVLLMGPMYHLLKEEDRERAVRACLNVLKPGGMLWVSFLALFSGAIYAMKFAPEIILSDKPEEIEYFQRMLAGENYAGPSFTQSFYINPGEILPFMRRFPLEKMHFFSQEGMLSPCEGNFMSAAPEVIEAWLDAAEQLAEREELLSWGEHLMYVGRMTGSGRPVPAAAEIQAEIEDFCALPVEFNGFACPSNLTDGVVSLRLAAAFPADPVKKYVPMYAFDICVEGQRVGHVHLRIGYVPGLYYGGNIGYGVDAAYRGHGYAGRACLLLRPVMRAHGMRHAYITNDVENAASRRVCEKLGLPLVRQADVPEWNELYRDGMRRVNIFDLTDA